MENFLVTFTQKNPSEFLAKQQAKSNKQRAKSNEQRAKSNKQRAKSNDSPLGTRFRYKMYDRMRCKLFHKKLKIFLIVDCYGFPYFSSS